MQRHHSNTSPRPAVIVNADDFGFDASVNQGILQSFLNGIVTSTSLMVNMPGVEEAVRLAKAHPKLGVGLHINLTYGTPLSTHNSIPTLVDKKGQFLPPGKFIAAILTGRIATEDLQTEIGAQFSRFQNYGLTCTHFDGHRHIHCIPQVFEVAAVEALKVGVHKCRISQDADPTALHWPSLIRPSYLMQTLKAKLLHFWAQRCAEIAKQHNIQFPAAFYGVVAMSESGEKNFFRDLIDFCHSQQNEIMCHPGLGDGPLRSMDGYNTLLRQRDLTLLTAPETRLAIEQRQLNLISFRELS